MTLAPLHPCPCCGQPTLAEPEAYEICPICGWEDDPAQRADPALSGGANEASLRAARRRWRRKLRNR